MHTEYQSWTPNTIEVRAGGNVLAPLCEHVVHHASGMCSLKTVGLAFLKKEAEDTVAQFPILRPCWTQRGFGRNLVPGRDKIAAPLLPACTK